MDDFFDLIVIGLGPAGLRACNLALKAGLRTLAFERENVGGCCLNRGCVPTKTILHSSEIYGGLKNCAKAGIISEGEIKADLKSIIERKNLTVEKLSKAAENELFKKGLKIVKEEAFIDFENLTVNGIKSKNIIIATGSFPFELNNLPFDKENILSSDEILNLESLPKTVAIIGTGAIGIEWARILSNFGVEVTLVEKMPAILPLFDIDIQKRMTRILRQKKVKILTGKTAVSFKDGTLYLDDNSEIKAQKVLVAVGRKKNIPANLRINPDLTTNYKNVYAAGDIASSKMLAHTASMQADYLINKVLGKQAALIPDFMIPSVIYGTPEAASVGINEQDIGCIDEYKIYNLPVSYLAKSWCDNQTDGFIKIIAKDNLIQGAHIVSPEASSLITQIQILMTANYKISNIKDIVFAHPTYSEGLYETIFNG